MGFQTTQMNLFAIEKEKSYRAMNAYVFSQPQEFTTMFGSI